MSSISKAVLTATLSGLLISGCGGTPPPNPAVNSVAWETYSNSIVGYSLEYPDLYEQEEHHQGRDVLFRYNDYPVISISHVDEKGGRSRGLWVKHGAVGSIQVSGRPGRQYQYDHYDGPFYMRTLSYVVAHQEKFLGLEFRINLGQPDAAQRRILQSFRFFEDE
jgi:hypothetical protein